MVEDAADKGIKVINLDEPDHNQLTRGRVSWSVVNTQTRFGNHAIRTRNYFQWNRCLAREYISAYDKE